MLIKAQELAAQSAPQGWNELLWTVLCLGGAGVEGAGWDGADINEAVRLIRSLEGPS